MGRKCEFYWCGNQQGSTAGKPFFCFPSDGEMCSRWVSSCNSSELSETFKMLGTGALKKRKICGDHFPSVAFRTPSRLFPGAVPQDYPCVPMLIENRVHEAEPSNLDDCQVDISSADTDYLNVEYLEDDVPTARESNLGDDSPIPDIDGVDAHTNVKEETIEWEVVDSVDICSLPQSSQELPQEYPELVPSSSGSVYRKHNHLEKLPPSASIIRCKRLLPGAVPQDNPYVPMLVENRLHEAKPSNLDDCQVDISNADNDYQNVEYLEYDVPTARQSDMDVDCPIPDIDDVNAHSNVKEETIEWEVVDSVDICSLPQTSQDPPQQYPELVPATSDSVYPLKAQLKVQQNQCKMLKLELNAVKRKLFVARQASERRKQMVLKKKMQLKKLRSEFKVIKKQKTADETIGRQAKQNPLILDSLRNESRSPKGRRYSLKTLKFASGVYLSGPRTYRFLRNSKMITLPHKNTVYNHNRAIRIEPGLNHSILSIIKKKFRKTKNKRNKTVMVSCDGMAIKPELSYCAKADTFHGFPDIGIRRKIEKNDVTKLATEAVTVMVSGLYQRFKQPIGYVLAHNSLESKKQFKFIEKCVREVRGCGLFPMAITMDQCSTNVKMAREAGVTTKAPLIDIDGQKVVFMFDTPHLTKNARNAIFKYNAVFDNKVASFLHIRHLYDADFDSSLKLVPKLTEKCINLPPFAAMNVALATRTLSESCAIAMRHYVNEGELPKAALETADFIELYDKLFDVFNSKDRYADSFGKADVGANKLKTTQRQPHFLGGFKMNIYAVRWLWRALKKRFDVPYLCTNPLCQDCLENFFSEVRRRCGFNDAPNAFQFGCAFKYAMLSAADQELNDGRNCQNDETRPIVSEDDMNDFPVLKRSSFRYRFEDIDPTTPFTAQSKDLNVLVYILGAAIHKLPHIKCREKLTAQKDDECVQNPDYSFSLLKARLSQRSVVLPNNSLYAVGMLAFVCFQIKFRKFLCENRRNVKKRLKTYVKFESYEECGICKSCFERLIDIIFNTLIQGFLRYTRVQQKFVANKKRVMTKLKKRNRKAVRMHLPVRV